jgi:hypothetical protein
VNIRNDDLVNLGNFLVDLKLRGKQSRMRTRFVKRLQAHLNIVKEEKEDILKQYGEVDEEGNLITKLENGKEVYVMKDKEACEKELAELYNEEMVIEENETNKEMLLCVGEAILNCNLEFVGKEAFEYDNYCELFENLTYERELAN